MCNAFANFTSTLWIQTIVGIFLYIVTLLYISYTHKTSKRVKISADIDLAAQLIDDDPEDDKEEISEEQELIYVLFYFKNI